jgi:hypothetical protein
MATLSINSGSVFITKYDEDLFGKFEQISINSGSAMFGSEAYGALSRRGGLSMNAGRFNVIDIKGKVVDVGNTIIDGSVDHSGQYLVGDFIRISTSDPAALRGVIGIYATTVLCPENFRFSDDIRVDANVYTHQEGAEIFMDGITLTESLVKPLAENGSVWTLHHVNALNSAAVAAMAVKNVSVRCGTLIINEEDEERYGSLFRVNDTREIIPEGCQYIAGELTLTEHNAELFAEKLYITGDLTVTQNAAAAFSRFTRVYVRGSAYIPKTALQTWKEIGAAEDNVLPYSGILWRILGHEEITHEQLSSALELGERYTLLITGGVNFADGVTSEDFGCFDGIYYVGSVALPASAAGAFRSKVVKGTGTVSTRALQTSASPTGEPAVPAAPPPESDGSQKINTGRFVLI